MINVSKLTLPQIMGITLFSFFIIMGFLAMKDSMETKKTSEGTRRFPELRARRARPAAARRGGRGRSGMLTSGNLRLPGAGLRSGTTKRSQPYGARGTSGGLRGPSRSPAEEAAYVAAAVAAEAAETEAMARAMGEWVGE